MDVAGYLRRLGIDDPGPPTAANLDALHRAQVERIPYEVIEIQLGCPTTVDPHEAAERIVTRERGGYCYHLNGAFSLLLKHLGYDVTWHRGGVQNHASPEPVGATGNHLALTVTGLPSDQNPQGDWFVDAGLGDALHRPLPLAAGRYHQGPFVYELRPSEIEPGGWRFEHDPSGTTTASTPSPAAYWRESRPARRPRSTPRTSGSARSERSSVCRWTTSTARRCGGACAPPTRPGFSTRGRRARRRTVRRPRR